MVAEFTSPFGCAGFTINDAGNRIVKSIIHQNHPVAASLGDLRCHGDDDVVVIIAGDLF